jgi:hypothetical protein
MKHNKHETQQTQNTTPWVLCLFLCLS